jgi:hypothetical protein
MADPIRLVSGAVLKTKINWIKKKNLRPIFRQICTCLYLQSQTRDEWQIVFYIAAAIYHWSSIYIILQCCFLLVKHLYYFAMLFFIGQAFILFCNVTLQKIKNYSMKSSISKYKCLTNKNQHFKIQMFNFFIWRIHIN